MMDDIRRSQLLAYCRIDDPTGDDLDLLERCYDGTVGYLAGAGVPEPEEYTPARAVYDRVVDHMVLDAWDNRGANLGAEIKENPTCRRMLNQLKQSQGGGVL